MGKNRRVVPYGFEKMDNTLTREEALGYLVFAASRNVYHRKVYQMYDDMIDSMARYSKAEAQFQSSQVWVKRMLESDK